MPSSSSFTLCSKLLQDVCAGGGGGDDSGVGVVVGGEL